MAADCAAQHRPVISGMAKGVDAYAHTACLQADGYTIAFLAHGLDLCYPAEHRKLKECLERDGLVLSEYPPGTLPAAYRFPRRNRLISAWSEELFVISAGARIVAHHCRLCAAIRAEADVCRKTRMKSFPSPSKTFLFLEESDML